MRVVIARWGSAGDVMPYIGVGWALARRGHDVTFVGNPYYEAKAREAGLAFAPAGALADHQRLMADADVFDKRRKSAWQVYEEHYYPLMPAYRDAVAAWAAGQVSPVMVCGETGSATEAERIGGRFVHIACAPATGHYARSRFDPPHPETVLPPWLAWFGRTGRRMALLHRLNDLRRGRLHRSHDSLRRVPLTLPEAHPIGALRLALGMPLTTTVMPVLALCLWPGWFAAPQPDWPPEARVTGFPFYPVPELAAGGPPAERRAAPLAVTTGSLAGSQHRFYQTVVEACRQLGRSAVLVTPHRDQVPADLPPGVTCVPFAPFADLFARSSLVIHHGGIGTAAYALAAGTPQIALPMRGDQFDNANRLVRLGVARMLRQGTPAGELAAAVTAMLGSRSVSEACRRWQARTDLHAGLERAADAIEAIAPAG